jgi:hypothetical protein
MIAPPTGPRLVAPPPDPPEFFFLGTQDCRLALLHPRLREIPKPGTLPPLTAFVEAVFFALDRVWILDPFFDHQHGLPALFEQDALLESRAHFRVISRERVPKEWLETRANWNLIASRLRWRPRAYAWFHGRFALVDGELWHFGSTVGGAYPGFDAASRWRDDALVRTFQEQFESLWGP